MTKAYHIELTICRLLKKVVGRFNGILYILPHHFVQFVPSFQFQVLYNPVKLTRAWDIRSVGDSRWMKVYKI